MVDQDTEDTTKRKKPPAQHVFEMDLGQVLDQSHHVTAKMTAYLILKISKLAFLAFALLLYKKSDE